MLEPINYVWIEILYRPIYNLVIFVYNLSPGPNIGLAIIGLAILIRLIFLHFTLRGYRTDIILENLNPYLEKIEEEEKHNPKRKRQRIAELLKGKDINVYSEIYTVTAQFIFLIILYRVFQIGFKPEGMQLLYGFISHPQKINTMFLGIDLSQSNLVLNLIASLALLLEQAWEYNAKKSIKRIKFSEKWFPLLLGLISYILLSILPSAKALFILVSVLFSLSLRTVTTLFQVKDEHKQTLPKPADGAFS